MTSRPVLELLHGRQGRFTLRRSVICRAAQGGKKVDELVGASPDKLQGLIMKHAGPPAAQDS